MNPNPLKHHNGFRTSAILHISTNRERRENTQAPMHRAISIPTAAQRATTHLSRPVGRAGTAHSSTCRLHYFVSLADDSRPLLRRQIALRKKALLISSRNQAHHLMNRDLQYQQASLLLDQVLRLTDPTLSG